MCGHRLPVPSADEQRAIADYFDREIAHWELIPLRFLVDIVGGAAPDTGKAEFWNGDISWVLPKDMKRNEIKDTENHISGWRIRSSRENGVNMRSGDAF
jgi:type I restriction enzyme S subunit